jgi:hypothetical protein
MLVGFTNNIGVAGATTFSNKTHRRITLVIAPKARAIQQNDIQQKDALDV